MSERANRGEFARDVDRGALRATRARTSHWKRLRRALDGKQIEADLGLAQDVLRSRLASNELWTLFAQGPDRPSVRVMDGPSDFDERALLGWLFGGDLLAGYRIIPPEIHVDLPAKRGTLEAALTADPEGRLPELIYFAGHGERRARIDQSFFTLSGGERMTVAELAALFDQAAGGPRLLVHSACYSGAFAEIIFRRGDASLGLSDSVRCGLFASSADDPASGCSASADQREYEGFALHFFGALKGRTHDDSGALDADLDGDGRISALEAHAIARAHAETIDIPTTSSERLLRYFFDGRQGLRSDGNASQNERQGESRHKVTTANAFGEGEAHDLGGEGLEAGAETSKARPIGEGDPIETFVIAELERALRVSSKSEAESALQKVEASIHSLNEVLAEAKDELEREASRLEARILELSPHLADAWDRRFEPALRRHRRALRALFDSDAIEPIYQAFELLELLEVEHEAKLIERARLSRLVRAHENLSLLRRLGELSAKQRAHYEAIRNCEAHPLFSL